MPTKRCGRCGETKPVAEFYKRGDGGARDPYRSRCKDCSKRGPGERSRRNALRAESPERAIRSLIIQRCENPSNPGFSGYGGRGIRVCERWRDSFEAFLEDMGPRPSPQHSIDRIDNDGHYEPRNCRWATKVEQNRNTRQNVLISIDGVTKCRSEWAEATGVPAKVIRDRMVKLGWPAKRAVFTPARSCKRRAA